MSLNPKQAAKELGVHYRTLCRWMDARLVPFQKYGQRTRRFTAAQIEEIQRRRAVGGVA